MSEPLSRVRLFRTPAAVLLMLIWALVPFGYPALPRGPRGDIIESSYHTALAGSAILATAVLALVLWRNRAGFASWGMGRGAWNASVLVLEWLLWMPAVLIPAMIFVGGYSDYTPRARVSELILQASPARSAVTENALSEGTLARSGDNVRIGSGPWMSAGIVAKNGTIVLYAEDMLVLAILVPSYLDGHVNWQCDVTPPRLGPSTCRTDGGGIVQSTWHPGAKFPGTASDHAASLRATAAPIQAKVARRAAARNSLRDVVQGRLLPRGGSVEFGLLDADGAIVLYNDGHGVFMFLEPSLKEGKVTWRCRLWPEEAKLAGCENPAR